MAKYNFAAGNKRLSGNKAGYDAEKKKELDTRLAKSSKSKAIKSKAVIYSSEHDTPESRAKRDAERTPQQREAHKRKIRNMYF